MSFPALHRGVALEALLPDDLLSDYREFRMRVARYRNQLHNPHPTQMWKEVQRLLKLLK